MPSKTLQQRLEEAKANSPVNELSYRQQVMSQVYNNESWKELQKEGVRKNAKNNQQWYDATVEKNQRIGKDPVRNKKISKSLSNFYSTDENKQIITEINQQRQAKKVTTPIGEFDSVTEAADALGIAANTLRRRCERKLPGYYIQKKNGHYKTTGKTIQTPFGLFSSKSEAGRFALDNNIMQNAVKKIDKFLKTDPENYYYIEQTT